MAERGRRRPRLDVPVESRRSLVPRPHYDPDAFGRFSEGIARYLGTGRFLAIQTVVVVFWISLNVVSAELRWDPYPFILLNLAFSTQAAYAAPLILLAQNRQADRDRISLEEDRNRALRNVADTEYLAREMAALRMSLGEVATREFLRDQLRELTEEVVARTSEGAGEVLYDRQARERREERERRAERKKRRESRAEDAVAVPGGSLAEPFGGDAETG